VNVDKQIDGQNMAANESKTSWKDKFPPGSAVLVHEIGTTQKSTTGIKVICTPTWMDENTLYVTLL
jgi:hypothetical protein